LRRKRLAYVSSTWRRTGRAAEPPVAQRERPRPSVHGAIARGATCAATFVGPRPRGRGRWPIGRSRRVPFEEIRGKAARCRAGACTWHCASCCKTQEGRVRGNSWESRSLPRWCVHVALCLVLQNARRPAAAGCRFAPGILLSLLSRSALRFGKYTDAMLSFQSTGQFLPHGRFLDIPTQDASSMCMGPQQS
jgi:hypothetical protein